MRFGLVLPTYPSGATVEGVAQAARAAERLGFASAWTTDHVILPSEGAGPYREIFEPLLTLAYLAALTERITLGVSVLVVPQRSGIVVAKELATLDHLCRGRLVVGVGAGWSEAEFRMLDAGERFGYRGAHLDETLQLWRHLWTTPEAVFQGRFYDLPPVAFGPPPYQADGPPLWVGGSSAGARRRAGRAGAAWHPVGTPASQIGEQAELVRRAAEGANRPMPEVVPRLAVHLGRDGGGHQSAGRLPVLAVEPPAMVEHLKEYERAGVAEIVCLFGSADPGFVVEQMERLASEVMPAFPAAQERA